MMHSQIPELREKLVYLIIFNYKIKQPRRNGIVYKYHIAFVAQDKSGRL